MFSKSIRKTQIRKPSQLCYETAPFVLITIPDTVSFLNGRSEADEAIS